MLKTRHLTPELVAENRRRRAILGRLMYARQKLSADGGQRAQKVVSKGIADLTALMRANQKMLSELGGMSAYSVEASDLMRAVPIADENTPLLVAYHILDIDDLGHRRGAEIGIVNACREACRGACIKAGIGDPRTR